MIEALRIRANEHIVALAIINEIKVMGIYANEDRSTWTILETTLYARGVRISCIKLVGKDLQIIISPYFPEEGS